MTLPRLIFALVIIPAATGVQAQSTIRTGYWESNERVVSPISTSKTERRCITRKDIAKFMSCYLNHHYQCACPEEAIGGGRIRYRGHCVDKKGGEVTIEGAGDFTPTTLRLTVHPAFRFGGLPIHAEASIDAHWLADACPAASPGG
ncbi:MAG: DUF3617 family protein [Caulobacteraceae bacterium]